MQRKRRIDEVNDQSSSSKQGLYECLFCALSTNQYGNLMEHLEHVCCALDRFSYSYNVQTAGSWSQVPRENLSFPSVH